MKKNKDDFKDDNEYQNFLQEFGARLHEINQIASQHEIFPNDREIVSCAQCGLTEDVAYNGKLFTYCKDDPEFKETGLLFISIDNNAEYLKCPVCSTEIFIPKEKE